MKEGGRWRGGGGGKLLCESVFQSPFLMYHWFRPSVTLKKLDTRVTCLFA